jgi:hypothetical protein
MMDASKYYKHSGIFSIPAFFLMLAMAVPLGLVGVDFRCE